MTENVFTPVTFSCIQYMSNAYISISIPVLGFLKRTANKTIDQIFFFLLCVVFY